MATETGTPLIESVEDFALRIIEAQPEVVADLVTLIRQRDAAVRRAALEEAARVAEMCPEGRKGCSHPNWHAKAIRALLAHEEKL